MAIIRVGKTDNNVWFGAKIIFGYIVEKLLGNEFSAELQTRLDIASVDNLGYLQLNDLDRDDRIKIKSKIIRMVDAFENNNTVKAGVDPGYYDGMLERLKELKKIINSEWDDI